jgi:hypothetical protein
MKKILLVLIAIMISIAAQCLPQNSRQRNTIYVLDCTGSMGGYNGAPDIWAPTKAFLKSELVKTAKETPNARVVILPFQDKVLTPINVNLRDIAWPQIEATLDGYLKNVTATNICDSWLVAEKYLDPSCENYIVLMTDGHDNIGGTANEAQRTARLSQILRDFCGKYANTKGFYVELTRQATLPEGIKGVIDLCPSLYSINAAEGIPSFGCWSDDVIHVNTRDLPADINLGFSNAGTFPAQLQHGDNQFVNISIKGGKISQGRIVLHIESKFGDEIEKLNRAIDAPAIEMPYTIVSDDVIITNPDIRIVLHTTPIRSLDVATDNGKLAASVKRVKPFLWIKGNEFDTLRWDLKPAFSEEARKDNGAVLFQLKSACDMSSYTVRYDGRELQDSLIDIRPDGVGVIEVIIPQSAKDSKVNLELKEVNSRNIDRINGARPDNTTLTLEGEYTTSMSVVEIIFWIVIGLLVLFLVLWFAFIRNQKYPKFTRGIINVQSPYFAPVRVKGARMVVLSPRTQTQGWFDKLWRGRIIYHANAAWPCEVEITPAGKNMRFRCPSGQLISDPSPLLTRGETYKIINTTDSTSTIDININ